MAGVNSHGPSRILGGSGGGLKVVVDVPLGLGTSPIGVHCGPGERLARPPLRALRRYRRATLGDIADIDGAARYAADSARSIPFSVKQPGKYVYRR